MDRAGLWAAAGGFVDAQRAGRAPGGPWVARPMPSGPPRLGVPGLGAVVRPSPPGLGPKAPTRIRILVPAPP
eukprot:10517402-Alexandrium_andersonii.AAC.1